MGFLSGELVAVIIVLVFLAIIIGGYLGYKFRCCDALFCTDGSTRERNPAVPQSSSTKEQTPAEPHATHPLEPPLHRLSPLPDPPRFTPSHRSAITQSHRSAITQSHRSAITPSHRSAITPSHRSAITQSHRSAITPSHRSAFTPTSFASHTSAPAPAPAPISGSTRVYALDPPFISTPKSTPSSAHSSNFSSIIPSTYRIDPNIFTLPTQSFGAAGLLWDTIIETSEI